MTSVQKRTETANYKRAQAIESRDETSAQKTPKTIIGDKYGQKKD